MITRYPELQSGFIAYPMEAMIKRPETPSQTPVALVLQPKLTRTQQEYFFSPVVEELCDRALNNIFILSDFNFHGEVFRVAGTLFDKKSIFQFMKMQEQAKHISALHAQFLIDTLATIYGTQYERLQQPQQWATQLSAANDPSVKPFRASNVTEVARCRPADELDQFLLDWVRALGISDLILSLQVIFGRRTLPASWGAAKY